MGQANISQQFADMYYLELKGGKRVKTSEFLSTFNSVLSRIKQEKPCFERFVKDAAIKFVYNDEYVPTISIDDRNNVYVSVNYLVLSLNMEEKLIYTLLLNAYYHLLHRGLDEEKKFLDDGMPNTLWGSIIRRTEGGNAAPKVQLTIPIHHDINIALELMANNSILNDHNDSITVDLLKKRMNAIYVGSKNSLPLCLWYHKKEVMDSLRGEVNHTFPLTPSDRPHLDSFPFGYTDTMRHLNEAVKVYKKNEAASLAANVTISE